LTHRIRQAALLLALLLVAGCWSGGPRKPIFGGDEAPAQRTPPTDAKPNQAQADTPEAVLLRDLRRAETDEQRRKLADELVARGEAVRPLVVAARDEEQLLDDLLDDVLRRLDQAAKRDPDAPARDVATTWVAEKYGLALDRYLAGDAWGALRLIDAILAIEPGAVERPKLLRLARRARDKVLRENVLVADLVPGAGTLVPKEPLRARVRLTNVGREDVVMRSDGTLGVVSVEFEELSQDGRRTRTRTEARVPAPRTIELAPGKSVELPVELPSPHAKLPAELLGRFRLGGRLRAHTMLVGDAAYPFFVPLLPAEVLVVQPGDLALATDARAAFHASVQAGQQASGQDLAGAARRAFVAGMLIARDDPDQAVALAVAALEAEATRGAVADAMCAVLARATGEPLGFTREEWLAWWKNHRSRPQTLREARLDALTEDEDPEAEGPVEDGGRKDKRPRGRRPVTVTPRGSQD
jgi:hypothetical protein